ncbi:MAG TPA: hypothetical protein GYA06_04980 [Chloroflexi bacterium]|nr:hypothetical protein [Chloroflexota bacterium]HPO58721.1 hypothetical protein [Anaerolineaceae bacterium]
MPSTESPSARLAGWRKRSKFRLQLTAALLAVAAPFLLYQALQSQANALAALLFGVIVFAFALAVWAG